MRKNKIAKGCDHRANEENGNKFHYFNYTLKKKAFRCESERQNCAPRYCGCWREIVPRIIVAFWSSVTRKTSSPANTRGMKAEITTSISASPIALNIPSGAKGLDFCGPTC